MVPISALISSVSKTPERLYQPKPEEMHRLSLNGIPNSMEETTPPAIEPNTMPAGITSILILYSRIFLKISLFSPMLMPTQNIKSIKAYSEILEKREMVLGVKPFFAQLRGQTVFHFAQVVFAFQCQTVADQLIDQF